MFVCVCGALVVANNPQTQSSRQEQQQQEHNPTENNYKARLARANRANFSGLQTVGKQAANSEFLFKYKYP